MEFSHIFPDEREKGETPLRQCQLVMLRMLKILDFLCDKHEVSYLLSGGSMLGAIRHNGFIPWDDDLDISMTRANYEKFIKLVVPELPADIFFQNAETDPYYPQCQTVEARLRDKYSSYKHLNTGANKWHEGLQVDIFVLDQAFFPSKYLIIAQNYLINRLFRTTRRRVQVLKLIGKYSPFSLVYASNFLHSFGQRKMGANYRTKQEVSSLIKRKFEDAYIYVSAEWDNCLSRQYGAYMKLPPPEKQVSNHDVFADAFTPCNHTQILHWKAREKNRNKISEKRIRNVLVIGVFDIFHRGHVELLRKAKLLGQRLFVAVNGDEKVAHYKRKPLNSENDRLEIVKSCKYVDEAFINVGYDTKLFIEKYNIDAIVHGDDWDAESYIKQLRVTAEYLEMHKIQLIFVPYTFGVSTTCIINRIKEEYTFSKTNDYALIANLAKK